jgi:hypothetical protein
MAAASGTTTNVVPIKPNRKIAPGSEYVTGNPYFTDQPRALPPIADTGRRGDTLTVEQIEQMLHDPDVYAGLMLLCLMALNEKLLITPVVKQPTSEPQPAALVPAPDPTQQPNPTDGAPAPVQDQPKDNVPPAAEQSAQADTPDAARAKRAQEITDFCQRQVDRVPKFAAKVFAMCFEGLAFGNKVSEQIIEISQRGLDASRWVLKDLKPKPREALAFVIDAFNNELGFIGARPGEGFSVPYNTLVDTSQIIPREKFAVFTYRPKDGNPLGQTALDAARNGWELKQRGWPEYLLFMMVCAIPGILATVKDDADEMTVYEDDGITPKLDHTGEVVKVSAHQFLLNMLGKMRNHQIGVAPEGTDVHLLQANGEGDVFGKFFTLIKKEIGMAILLQELATRDAEHQTKGATTSQFGVIDLLVWWIRDTLADMVRYDIFKPLVRYNFGDADADELLPLCSYGDTEARAWATDATAAAALAEKLTESQWDYVTAQLGIPPPTEAERAFRRQAAALMQQMQQRGAQQQNGKPGDETGKNDKPGADNANADDNTGAGNQPKKGVE